MNSIDAEQVDLSEQEVYPINNDGITPMSQMFPQNNYKEVIQEYTNEENPNDMVTKTFWGVNSKSLVLGFNDVAEKNDYQDNFEMSKLWDIMKDTPEDFTWDKGQNYMQVDFLLRARINRSILRPNGGMNERMAQNTQISQNISSNTLRQGNIGGSGAWNNIRNGIDKVLR